MKNKIEYKIKRNPTLSLLNNAGDIFYKILCIGDPHLGKSLRQVFFHIG